MHRCDVDDEAWAATVVGDRLRVRGDIDVSNVDRFTRVLRSAVTAGVSTVDLVGAENPVMSCDLQILV